MRLVLGFAIWLALLAASLSAAVWFWALGSPLAPAGAPRAVVITKGTSYGQLVEQMQQQGQLQHPQIFYWMGRLLGVDRQIKAGIYALEDQISHQAWLAKLAQGQTQMLSVTLIPGSPLSDIWQSLCHPDQHLRCPPQPQWSIWRHQWGSDMPLEGQFMAETYHYAPGIQVEVLLEQAHRELWQYLHQAWLTRQQNLPLATSYEALILASIVEKETADASERPLIAGVFLNRLKQKMRLQSDPTVIYAMGEAYAQEPRIRRKDLDADNPYNTYKIKGLPPTPIALASKASIDAVLHPESTPYLYFVAKGQGQHHFSTSLEEHQRAVKRYILKD